MKIKKLLVETVVLDGESLTLEQLVAVSRGVEDNQGNRQYARVSLAPIAVQRLKTVRSYIESNWLNDEAPVIYGFNTGVGPLKNIRISAQDNEQFQYNLMISHAADFGEPAPEEVVRATMLTRANSLAKGVSGVRPEVINRFIEMLNRGVHPLIPEQGSVGASGDLGPMAHVAISMMGLPESEAYFKGRLMSAPEALKKAGLKPVKFTLKGKEGLAIVNGCSFALGYGALAVYDAWRALHSANLSCAMSMEALRGEMDAYDHRLHIARNHEGQIKAAEEIRGFLADSQWTTDKGRQVRLSNDSGAPWKPRVQDAYALRCAPQVNGAAWDMVAFAQQTIEREMNGAIDNPLIFPTASGEAYEALSGGNFHGQQIAFATDLLSMAIHEVGNIAERRSSRQLDPALNFGLPPNLIGSKPGLHTGFPVTQNGAAALVMENRTLCGPTSIDSIPNKSNQEDHVSQATWSARKARMVVENVFKIIGIECLCACQSISLAEPHMKGLALGKATARVYRRFRKNVPMVVEDRYMYPLIKKAIGLIRSGELLAEAGQCFLN